LSLSLVKVEDALHEVDIVCACIHHLHNEAVSSLHGVLARAQLAKVAGQLGTDAVLRQNLAQGVDFVGEGVGGRPTVGHVELDAKVGVRTAGVVAGREDDAARGLVFPAQQQNLIISRPSNVEIPVVNTGIGNNIGTYFLYLKVFSSNTVFQK